MSAEADVGTTNDYASSQGVLASSTGNVYGIYDLSGGVYEYVATYYRNGTTLSNGDSFAKRSANNTEWSTIYEGQAIENNYIIGDATKETRNWNNDGSWFVANVVPFFDRGGSYKNGVNAGIFASGREDGGSKEIGGFRLSLII